MSETDAYRANGYVAVAGLLPVEVAHAFYQRMQSDLEKSGKSMRDFAATGPLLKHEAIEIYADQYPPMRGLLWGLTPRIAMAVGADLLPTYAYFRLYQHDDVCRIHSDRLACEHSLSLTLAYANDIPWSLSVAKERNEVFEYSVGDDFGEQAYGTVAMRPGDGVIYQGTHHRHGRLQGNPNAWSAHLFLHWVDRNGRYSSEAFDRPTIEQNSRGRAEKGGRIYFGGSESR